MAKFAVIFALAFLAVIISAQSIEEHGRLTAINAPTSEEALKKSHSNVPPEIHIRGRRAATCGTQTKMHPVQVKEVVLAHNQCRAREKATNMHALTWSDELAAVAQSWADKCQWEHGYLYDCSGDRMGQNLFIEASVGGYPALNVTGVTEAWWNEVKDWDFATGQCKSGKVCGHWSQVVAASSGEVGCGFAQCPTISVGGQPWKFALLVVCDYYRPGNQQGEKVYEQGTACSNCDAELTGGGFKCNNGLCERCFPKNDTSCKCGKPLLCEHGATWDTTTCSCLCTKGYYGVGCEHTCTCDDLTPENCGFWVGYCHVPDYDDYMSENCKKTCQYPCSLPPGCT